MKEGFDISDVIRSWEMSLYHKHKKEDKEGDLVDDPDELDRAVFFRSFFFQF